MEYFTLYNGVKMPVLGYGIYQIEPENCKQCVLDALAAGYRAFDTAQSYANEEYLGEALKESGIDRGEVFITTKIRPHFYGGWTYQSVLDSLEKLQTDYIDLVLLHQPFGDVYRAWRDLEKLYEEGKVRAIGVSNFYADRMVDMAYFTKIRPMVNQIERHPLHQRQDILDWAKELDILVMAWSPFGHGRGQLQENAVLNDIAAKYGKTAAQVILRWDYQTGVATIPKTTNAGRMAENIDIFDFALTDEELQTIAQLETGVSVFYSHQDPKIVENYARSVLRNLKQLEEEQNAKT